jgi:hypothetical protein
MHLVSVQVVLKTGSRSVAKKRMLNRNSAHPFMICDWDMCAYVTSTHGQIQRFDSSLYCINWQDRCECQILNDVL